jgi:hypothetical protein
MSARADWRVRYLMTGEREVGEVSSQASVHLTLARHAINSLAADGEREVQAGNRAGLKLSTGRSGV